MTDTKKNTEELGVKKEPSCCDEKKEKKYNSPVFLANLRKNLTQTLIAFLGLAVAINIIVMTYFTVTVNKKLGEAIDITKPQEGKLTLIVPLNCPNCGDLTVEKKKFLAENVEITDDKILSADSEEAKNIINEFGLQRLPALVFQSEKEIKNQLVRAFKDDAQLDQEKTIVWEPKQPLYFDVNSNMVVGMVKAIYITDNSCTECYDVMSTQRSVFQQFGIVFASEKTVDISEVDGKNLLDKYKITSVPTIIMSPETKEYENLNSVWSKVGTIELDGAYVFRNLNAINVIYKDLATGEMILKQ
ncbi:MAG: hypothetical protein CO137_01820 [Candidatus Magasanikbacteria bacterium CG_4_9_14_3_um_filter_32_9]|uniref:Thioredoxin-like fold domain-containing protein n=1 Tax=Candidatus Magasanikbacteria bacterium CG_4_9_14_3_um_filter_32_9 TaxID=1974644 RepID=A0A2M7Z747_9BACT|nr:MAG: hypothetical protein CO137_01820 [Candidatus Magasanikbacteria bacterium CG_4_9_14_3_um_filter_32_9]